MKLIVGENPYLSKEQLRKVLLATSIITLVLYSIAAICPLFGIDYFILKYQNTQMDKIEAFFDKYNLMWLARYVLMTIEFYIVLAFILRKKPRLPYVLIYFMPPMVVQYFIVDIPTVVYTIFTTVFQLVAPLIEQLITTKKISGKEYLKAFIRFLIAMAVTLLLQFLITQIKAGYFDGGNAKLSLSAHIIYSLEYEIALLVILATISLYIHREKGDGEVCQKNTDLIHQPLGGSSQMSTKKSQTSKVLTKKQKNKIRLFYAKVYLIQLGTFCLVMILPFLLGKVLEFLTMYLSFAIVRHILGFKYSLHFKKETTCAFIGVVIFGILSLAVPFFYVLMVLAITYGSSLAILLHFSYKYKGLWLFNKVAKPDKFAEIYVMFNGNLSEEYVRKMCKHYNLSPNETEIIWELASGDKMSVIAYRHNYSVKTIERQLNEAIIKLKNNI